MKRKVPSIIKIVGIISIILGIVPILNYLITTVYMVQSVRAGVLTSEQTIFLTGFIIISSILPVAKVVVGYGLFSARRWSRKAGIYVFTIDFILGLMSAIFFCIQCYRFRDMPPHDYDTAMVAGTVSMWPTYIVAFVSLLFVAILSRDSIKGVFYLADHRAD